MLSLESEMLHKIRRKGSKKMNQYQDTEFFLLIQPIMENKEFQRTRNIDHHGITRMDHSLRVAYFSYKITKALKLDYEEVTPAALLHDFFLDEVEEENSISRLRKHPACAVVNATKYFSLSDKQIDIIKTHMFPITFTPPKYLEGWIVDLVDDFAAIYEKTYTVKRQINAATTFMIILLINILKIR